MMQMYEKEYVDKLLAVYEAAKVVCSEGVQHHWAAMNTLSSVVDAVQTRQCKHPKNMLLNPNTGMLHCPDCNENIPAEQGQD